MGEFSFGALDRVAKEFGWEVERACSLDDLRELNGQFKAVAVLFEAKAFEMPWRHAVKSVLAAAPAALPIVCHRFSEEIGWPELAEAGAFHALPLPLEESELRQSLSFVWAARAVSKTVVLDAQKRAQSRGRARARTAGFVA